MKKINVLGTEYSIEQADFKTDPRLEDRNGYCDKTTKRIVIDVGREDSDLGNFNEFVKKVTRHEIIHAFFEESGLAENYEHAGPMGIEETIVDWIAIQFPKIKTAFEQAECL